MSQVAIVGCGVVGAAIAYHLSQIPQLQITVFDRQAPAQGATGASLGVLMAAISTKTKGRNLQMRLASVQRYNEWIPQLEALTDRKIPFNRQGILRLCFAEDDLDRWRSLAEIRQQQGWRLELWNLAQIAQNLPHVNLERVTGAVYSPDDRQVDPTALTLALVEAAQRNGVEFRLGESVVATTAQSGCCQLIQTDVASYAVDWLIVAAGLGSKALTTQLAAPIDVQPVLGQAMQVRLPRPLGHANLQPMMTGEDTHLVPLGDGDYWVGATVEFRDPESDAEPTPDPLALELVRQRAIALWPDLAQAAIVRQWVGLRPRPEGRPAPIIEHLPGYENVIVATGHYRNGILLAPATAEQVRSWLADH